MSGTMGPERRGPERPGPDYPPEWDDEPDDDGVDWAEVARADRAARGECWYKTEPGDEGSICQVHGKEHNNEP